MVAVAFAAVSKRYGTDDPALERFTLDVDDGTICCLVGPSGSGKSTALRLLAGLEEPTDGHLRLGTKVIDGVPTRNRNLGMVTQRDALLPGRPTGRSIALPVELRDSAGGADQAVRDQARALDIVDLLDRRPDQLSGGETQIAQIARAMIARPDVLLLDEPLARIDPARRAAVRADLVRLQRTHGVTTLWVTADQADAMAVADRVAVLFGGRLAQVGAPLDVYHHPRTLAVARFVGEPEIGVLEATVRGVPGDFWLDVAGQQSRIRTPDVTRLLGRGVLLGIRPHELTAPDPTRPAGPDAITVRGTVTEVEAHGRGNVVTVDVTGAGTLRWDGATAASRVGDRAELLLDPARAHLFDPTGVAVHHPGP